MFLGMTTLTVLTQKLTHLLDKSVLYGMNRRVSDVLPLTEGDATALEGILAQTQVNEQKTAVYNLTAPGEHIVWLSTPGGDIACRVRVHLDSNPHAPLVLFHHGIAEYPYTNAWRRIFGRGDVFGTHSVCVQAPFHHTWRAPFEIGFATLQNIYQMVAGSLRLLEVMQTQFESQGTALTVAAGVSWGGMTSLLYEGIYGRTHAVIPMFASPDLAQVIWDTAQLFDRDLPLPLPLLKERLDFTPFYRRCDPGKIHPLLGEEDQFFRVDHHTAVLNHPQLVTIPSGHITGLWQTPLLRQHIQQVLETINTL